MIENTTDIDAEVYRSAQNFNLRLFLELFTVVGAASICCNILIVFVVVKYQKLHHDVTNILMVHLNVLQAAFLFCAPLTIRAATLLDIENDVPVAIFCSLVEVETQMLFAIGSVLTLLLLDWYLKLYHQDKYVKFCRVYKFLLGVVYLVLLFGSALTTQFCARRQTVYRSVEAVFVGSIVMAVVLAVLNVVHQVKKRKLTRKVGANVGLAVANIFVLCWCPCVVSSIVSMFLIPEVVAVIVTIVFGFVSPILNVLYLFRCESNYNVFFKKVLRCKCNDYENENLEGQTVVYNDTNGVHI